MRSHILQAIFLSLVICLYACNQPPQTTQVDGAVQTGGHNSENSLDWYGTYTGTLPCADCEGIQTSITLNEDKSYTLTTTYLGKGDEAFEQEGTFSWNTAGNTITLKEMEDGPNQYFVGENTLTQLDREGNKITGDLAQNYILTKGNIQEAKAMDKAITNTHWKLTELIGQPIDTTANQKEAFILLSAGDNRMHGNGGCNNIIGSYEMLEGNRIRFSKVASTQMACPNMETEAQLLKVLESADNYSVRGNQLTLNKARMAPLARFEAGL